MSNRQDGKFRIPLPIIIIAYILSPTVGILLTILAVIGSTGKLDNLANGHNSRKQDTEEKEPVSVAGSTDRVKKTKQGHSKKKKLFSVTALVCNILSAVFFLCSVIRLLEGVSVGFSADVLIDTVTMVILGLGCLITAIVSQKRTACRNAILSIIGKRETMDLDKLASMADISPKRLKKELQKLIDKEAFGDEAFMDLATGRFMRHPDLVMEAADSNLSADVPPAEAEPDHFRSIILQIRKLNDDIKNYAVSERIYRIEELTQNIFNYVTEHPEAMNHIRTFMNYYLPTTLKLLSSYSRIEQMGVAGDNMKQSKEKIENILDLLVVGFEQQVDQLFRHESMDISSEIKVLETMMRQDGLDGKTDFDSGYSDDLSHGGVQTMPED